MRRARSANRYGELGMSLKRCETRVFANCTEGRNAYLGTARSEGSFDRKHHFSSWLNSVTSMPCITMNLQLSISRDSSSSGNWQDTRQYWHSWFQQNRPYGIVSGLMNWKQRKSELRSGT